MSNITDAMLAHMLISRNIGGMGDRFAASQPLTKADLDAYFKKNSQSQSVPVQGVDPAKFINPRYTKAPTADNTLSPLAQFQAFNQSGQMPAQQSSFVPWQQPATPMMQAAPVATSTKGVK